VTLKKQVVGEMFSISLCTALEEDKDPIFSGFYYIRGSLLVLEEREVLLLLINAEHGCE